MGFTFNGISSKQMGIYTRMSVENRIPDIRNNTDAIAGRNGVVDFGQTIGERRIEISCLIPPGQTVHGLLSLKDRLVAWLNPENGLCELKLDTEPGRKYYARIEDGISFERLVRTSNVFNLIFFCPDPYAYADSDEKFILTGSGNIKREQGNVRSHPVYELKGELGSKTDTIVFSVNGESVTICGPLKKSQTLVIDSDNMTAKLVSSDGSENNALGQMKELVFPYLEVGENTITLGSDGGDITSLTINAKSRWL